jgi:hypothetical protein
MPVPGRDIDPCTPESLPLSVSWKGPSLNDLVYDLIPFSVMLTPAMVRSKLMGDFFVITNQDKCKTELKQSLRQKFLLQFHHRLVHSI